jgi:hypothetical protein
MGSPMLLERYVEWRQKAVLCCTHQSNTLLHIVILMLSVKRALGGNFSNGGYVS